MDEFENYGNTSPEEILEELNQSNREVKGKLKIFFGYIAGVGKTYAMLKAAQLEKKNGKDIVVGYVEPHARPETTKLLKGLEVLPTKEIDYHGIKLKEFDLDMAISRKPEIILVDELAHTNASGLRHQKRYQDIEELLRHGIDVYTTLNVQHLETLNDIVENVTGVVVNERVPDYIFDKADKVEIIDIEPEELIKRLNEGKIYYKSQATQALSNFFTRTNLEALREIALRRIADRLNKTKTAKSIKDGKKIEDNILVCISPSPSNAKVIRAAARIAEAFHGTFTALYVENPDVKNMEADNTRRLQMNIKLAEQLGAKVTVLYGYEPANQIASFIKMSGVTKLILGKNNSKSRLFLKKTLLEKLVQQTGNIDIYLIPDNQKKYNEKRRKLHKEFEPLKIKELLKMLGIIIIVTCIGFIFYNFGTREANIIIIYILGILMVSVYSPGPLYGLIASFLTVLLFNYCFTEPRFSLAFYDPEYFLTFAVLFITSIISSTLTTKVKNQAKEFSQKAYYTELLMNTTHEMMICENQFDIIKTASLKLSHLLERDISFCLLDKKEKIQFYKVSESSEIIKLVLSDDEIGVVRWVIQNNKNAGPSTDTLVQIDNLFLAVRGSNETIGIVIVPIKNEKELTMLEKNLMLSILNECGLMIERRILKQEQQKIQLEAEKEKWKSNILSAISHDFRSPLTSISGNALILMEESEKIDVSTRYGIYENIYDDALWLYNLTENLLYITRMNTENIRLNMEYESFADIIDEALHHVDRNAKDHNIVVHNEDEYILAKMEARLIIQVIINLVNNAIKYTPKNSNIVLSTKKEGNYVRFTIADDGDGIDKNIKDHLFEMFYSTQTIKIDSKRGIGLGLNLCKMIIEAHGSELSVYDNVPKGTCFTFLLEGKEVGDENE